MNIYFSCSITGGRADETVYREIVAALQGAGHVVPTASLASPGIKDLEMRIDPRTVYERDIAWIDGCQAVVAEVSTPSHGVGYEIAYALQTGKPVACLYRDGRTVSKMLTGNSHPRLRVFAYREPSEALAWVLAWLDRL
jgi:nucleoside 2-deoxyribosyltransferase